LSLPSSSIPPSLASLPSPLGFPAITVRPFAVAVFFRSSFFGFSSVAARFFFRRRSVFLPLPSRPFFRRRRVFLPPFALSRPV